MKKLLGLSIIFLSLFLNSCSNNPTDPETNEEGSISFSIDKSSAPSGIVKVVFTLSREYFENITCTMDFTSDTSAQSELTKVPAGTWHLYVEAKNESGIVEYYGETDVTVEAGKMSLIDLTLNPALKNGGIRINVRWNVQQWKDYYNNPVLPGDGSVPGVQDVRHSKVIYDEGKYKMWFNVGYPSGHYNIWYAESPNGKTWTVIGNEPVLNTGDSSAWDSYTVVVSAVLKENGQYKMYYIGMNDHPFNSYWNIGLAVSDDGIHWTKHPAPLLNSTDNYYQLGVTDVLKKDNVYYMYFGYRSLTSSLYKIGLATSSNGTNWEMCSSNPILTATLGWENEGISYPSAILENNKFKMVYMNQTQTAFGMAESGDGVSFTKEASPIFTINSTTDNWVRIAYPFFRKLNGEYRIYYSGEVPGQQYTNICLAQKI